MDNRKHDLVEYPIQDNVRLQSYWRDDAGGRGPAASLYVYDDEIMRFDCFGGDNGHCHFNLRQTRGRRWMYPEGTFKDHIQQSLRSAVNQYTESDYQNCAIFKTTFYADTIETRMRINPRMRKRFKDGARVT